ncbi:MAG: anhydro-N-acetylmuramic acid kinase [Gemmataceae bacterium]|nr:anhydro-N-acetylmuramic acid kinase [Gemmata sp.]MDW8197814.1 anhydro-N-acetylmuramic acid kinase [Gemmataceae bacterium]
MPRILLGLSVSSGLEGVDAAVVRAEGLGLELRPRLVAALRVVFPPAVRDWIAASRTAAVILPEEVVRAVAETAVFAARQVLGRATISAREVFAAGFLEPARPATAFLIPWPEVVGRLAHQLGITTFHGFPDRDRAAGGSGRLITVLADYLLLRDVQESRLLIHLGAVASLVFVPARASVSATVGFEIGPGNQFLDTLLFHGTRGKECVDAGGKKAVQGKCIEPLITRWLEHPHLLRRPPKVVHPDTFGRSFLLAAFEQARECRASLADLLCTATHWIAKAIGQAVRGPGLEPQVPRRVILTGGGVRNGFLWQLVAQQCGGHVERADSLGLPALGRNATAAAILTAVTSDGIAGNLPALTGASSAQWLGHICPGDQRHWSRCCAWMAEQLNDVVRAYRVA